MVNASRIPVQDYLDQASRLLETSRDVGEILREMAAMLVPQVADWCIVWSIDGDVWRPMACAHHDSEKIRLLENYADYVANSEAEDHHHSVARLGRRNAVAEISDAVLGDLSGGDQGYRDFISLLAPRSLMSFPLRARARTVGLITMATTEMERRYSEEDVETAGRLCGLFALALDNAQLFSQKDRVRQRLQTAYNMASFLLQHPDIQEGATELLHNLGQRLGWDVGVLWTFNQSAERTAIWESPTVQHQASQQLVASPPRKAPEEWSPAVAAGRPEWITDWERPISRTRPARAWLAMLASAARCSCRSSSRME